MDLTKPRIGRLVKTGMKTSLRAGMLGLVLVAITACSSGNWDWMGLGGGDPDPQRSERYAPPQLTGPLENLQPFEAKEGGRMGALGLNLETYLATNIEDPEQRIARLEKAVIALHRDLSAAGPALQRLAGMEQEFARHRQAPGLHGASAAPQPLAPGPTVQPTPAASQISAPPPVPSAGPPPAAKDEREIRQGPGPIQAAAAPSGTTAVTGVRIGDHPGKVRIVLDVSGDTSFSADLDNNEKILLLDLPGTTWATVREKSFGSHPLLRGYRIEPAGDQGGSIVILELKKASKVLYEKKLDALSGGGKRLVIDLQI